MWFVFALVCLLSWGCADLFYKKGTECNDRDSHLKIAVWVGLIMGLMALGIVIFTGTSFSFTKMLHYAPASIFYILSMVIGYVGLRYLAVSIVSPVQNTSGALCAILFLVAFGRTMDVLTAIGTIIICVGMVALAVLEQRQARKDDGDSIEKKHRIGALALIFPLLYCLFDTLGTFADGILLSGDDPELAGWLGLSDLGIAFTEFEVLVAYGATFFLAGVIAYIIMLIRNKKPYNPLKDRDKATAAVFENFGQFFYVFALADRAEVTAPMVASYCVVSVILSRIFLKEKLTKWQYIVVSLVLVGIVILGLAEGISYLSE